MIITKPLLNFKSCVCKILLICQTINLKLINQVLLILLLESLSPDSDSSLDTHFTVAIYTVEKNDQSEIILENCNRALQLVECLSLCVRARVTLYSKHN